MFHDYWDIQFVIMISVRIYETSGLEQNADALLCQGCLTDKFEVKCITRPFRALYLRKFTNRSYSCNRFD